LEGGKNKILLNTVMAANEFNQKFFQGSSLDKVAFKIPLLT
jgi:hypothetical protein